MSDEPPRSVQAIWQGQPVDAKRFSTEDLQAAAARFQRTVRLRNVREHVAAVLVIVIFGVYAWSASTWLSKAGPALIVLGTVYVMFQLSTRAASKPVPSGEACIDFHRRELERQRDLLRSVWRWYIGPLVPGLVVLFVDRFLDAWQKGGFYLVVSVGAALVCALVLFVVARINGAAAQKLQREIDALSPDG